MRPGQTAELKGTANAELPDFSNHPVSSHQSSSLDRLHLYGTIIFKTKHVKYNRHSLVKADCILHHITVSSNNW
jgi:hypothetical protein